MCTAKAAQLRAHVDSKHGKEDPLTCFPTLTAMDAAEALAIENANKPKVVKKDGGDKKKKDKGGDLDALFAEGLKVTKKKK